MDRDWSDEMDADIVNIGWHHEIAYIYLPANVTSTNLMASS